MSFKDQVKHEVKAYKNLTKDQQIKKLTNLARKLARDADALSNAYDYLNSCYKKEKDDRLSAESNIETIANILAPHIVKEEEDDNYY